MITIVDYGMGNLGSLRNMFKRIGINVQIQANPQEILNAEKIVLPGVGAFDAAMQRINEISGLRQALDQKALVDCVPMLGICLGMQLLTTRSEEGQLPGLGWIPGQAKRFPNQTGLKVPHMGWNLAHASDISNRVTMDLGPEPRYYFVHSYYVLVDEPQHSLMRTHYGMDFDSAINRDHIYGVQFHPEKSHRFGMKILRNFAAI